MDVLVTDSISENRSLTKAGFLLCENVVIGRLGVMLYTPQETGTEAGPDGIVRVTRNADEVFRPESMASMNGMAITVRHPSDLLDPDTWQESTVGTVLNTRRSETDPDLLVADLLVMDADAIALVRPGMQVSAGYDSRYTQTATGEAVQSNITYNHLALLPDQPGRCGSTCSVTDHQTVSNSGESPVKASKKSFVDRIRAAFKTQDAAAFESAVKTLDAEPEDEKKADEKEEKETEDEESEVTLESLAERIAALEAAAKKTEDEATEEKDEKKESKETEDDAEDEDEAEDDEKETEDKKSRKSGRSRKSKDSATVTADPNVFQSVIARAEILSPGIALPTFDSADGRKTMDSLCALRRKALTNAVENPKFREALLPLVSSSEAIKSFDCATLSATFIGASEIVKLANAAKPVFDASSVQPKTQTQQINEANAKFWASRQ